MTSSGEHALPPEVLGTIDKKLKNGEITGLVIAQVDGAGDSVHAFGTTARLDGRVPDAGTFFETGSVGKVLTGLLLADMVQRGEVSLDDLAEKHIRPRMQTPQLEGRTFSLLDLVTHRAGLPFDAQDPIDLKDVQGPLSRTALQDAPGKLWSYSNLGMATLGRALADAAGMPFEALVRERILEPLGMRNSFYVLPEALDKLKARGHSGLMAVPLNDTMGHRAYFPCGGLITTAADLLLFMRAHLGLTPSPLWEAMEQTRQRRFPIWPGCHIGLVWELHESPLGDIASHGGQNFGNTARLAYRLSDKKAVILLANSTCEIDDIAFHLLDPAHGLKPVHEQDWDRVIVLAEGALKKFKGSFVDESHWGDSLEIEPHDGGLSVQVAGAAKYRFVPQTEDEFICPSWRLRIRFVRGPEGTVDSLHFSQVGYEYSASRR